MENPSMYILHGAPPTLHDAGKGRNSEGIHGK